MTTRPSDGAAETDALVFMFPGQSSRYPRMIEKLTSESRSAKNLLAQATDILNRDLSKHFRASNDGMFDNNRDVQLGIFIANHMHMTLLEEEGVRAKWSLGLSLGEYNHLVHIGAISFEAALRLVDLRGRLFERGPDGAMVSLFPIEADELERLIADLKLQHSVVVGLYNSPRQQVISGSRAAIEKTLARIDDEMLVDAIEIEPRIPMHSPLFHPVAEAFGPVLAQAQITPPKLGYVSNARGGILEHVTPEVVRDCLATHVCTPVRWRECVEAVAAKIANPLFLEVGPRAVLYNLFGRGWNPGRREKTDAAENWGGHFRQLVESIRNGL